MLILAVRNLATGAEALDSILKKYPGTKAQVFQLDLNDFASVRDFSARVLHEFGRCDVALLNAG
jgi:NAD(P)-dependent dehydrogenase (short-subunit alcohol dehydrogenase family)